MSKKRALELIDIIESTLSRDNLYMIEDYLTELTKLIENEIY
jgi:hypothetical protein